MNSFFLIFKYIKHLFFLGDSVAKYNSCDPRNPHLRDFALARQWLKVACRWHVWARRWHVLAHGVRAVVRENTPKTIFSAQKRGKPSFQNKKLHV